MSPDTRKVVGRVPRENSNRPRAVSDERRARSPDTPRSESLGTDSRVLRRDGTVNRPAKAFCAKFFFGRCERSIARR